MRGLSARGPYRRCRRSWWDHFHPVRLAIAAVTAVRQRVTWDNRGRRGRTIDPGWTLRELEERNFITITDNPGHPPRITPLLEMGGPVTYAFVPAPEAHARATQAGQQDQLAFHRYFRVPSSPWTEGHIARLKGPSLVMIDGLQPLVARVQGPDVGQDEPLPDRQLKTASCSPLGRRTRWV